VVASEVRTLAHRSAGAAKEIKELIGNTVQTVESGSRLVDEAGATMLEVVDSVQRVTAIMGEMSNANQEQNEGIERINSAIVEFDEVDAAEHGAGGGGCGGGRCAGAGGAASDDAGVGLQAGSGAG
jgi:methyl-accepting chemotaxis protein